MRRLVHFTVIFAAFGSTGNAPAFGQDTAWQPSLRVIDIAAHVAEAAQRFGLPEQWIYAVMRTESAGRIGAVSSAGAMGLMQLAALRRIFADLEPGRASAPGSRWEAIRLIRATTSSRERAIFAKCMTATARPAFLLPIMQVRVAIRSGGIGGDLCLPKHGLISPKSRRCCRPVTHRRSPPAHYLRRPGANLGHKASCSLLAQNRSRLSWMTIQPLHHPRPRQPLPFPWTASSFPYR